MEFFVIPLAAILVSAISLFSGFGLGTLLMPAFALFFPAHIAVALTAVVHSLNNFFRFFRLRKRSDRGAVIRFGIPAVPSALAGALLLDYLSQVEPFYSYSIGGRVFNITILNTTIGFLIAVFAFLEVSRRFRNVAFDRKYLPLGGVLSGFFGGLSGHQGAFRSMFLLRSGLSKDAFIATGVTAAMMVDIPRLSVYASQIAGIRSEHYLVLGTAVLSALLGSLLAEKAIPKVTMSTVRNIITGMLVLVSFGLMAGLI